MATLWLLYVVVIYSASPDGTPPFAQAAVAEWTGSEGHCLARLAQIQQTPRLQVKLGGAGHATQNRIYFGGDKWPALDHGLASRTRGVGPQQPQGFVMMIFSPSGSDGS
jgi:hypothetical protein